MLLDNCVVVFLAFIVLFTDESKGKPKKAVESHQT